MYPVKRLLMMLALLALAACSPDENAQAQKEAADAFNDAMTHVRNASAGYPAGQGQAPDVDYEAFRIKELTEAAKKLEKIKNKGSNAQKSNASMTLSFVLSELGADATTRAASAWARHQQACDEVRATLARSGLAGELAQTYGSIDTSANSEQLAEMKQTTSRQRNDLLGKVSQIELKLRDLQRQKDKLDAKRKELTLESNDYRNRSYEAKGELRYELYLKSANLSLEADNLGAQAERLGQDIAQLQSDRRDHQHQLRWLDERLAGIQRAMASVTGHSKSYQDHAARSSDEAEALAGQLIEQLGKLNEDHKNRVRAAYAEATGYTRRAGEAAKAGASRAPRLAKRSARATHALRAMANARLHEEAARADAGFAYVVELISDAADESLPAQTAATIREMHAALGEQAKASNDAAVEAYEQAAAPIDHAAENARDEQKTEALVRQVDLYTTLADLSGELAYREKLDEAKANLQAWQDEQAQQAAEEAALEAEEAPAE